MSGASASGGTPAPDPARLRSGAKINAGCPREHVTAIVAEVVPRAWTGSYRSHSRSGKCGLARNQAAEWLQLSTACMASGTASVIQSIFNLQIENSWRNHASKTRIGYPQIPADFARVFRNEPGTNSSKLQSHVRVLSTGREHDAVMSAGGAPQPTASVMGQLAGSRVLAIPEIRGLRARAKAFIAAASDRLSRAPCASGDGARVSGELSVATGPRCSSSPWLRSSTSQVGPSRFRMP